MLMRGAGPALPLVERRGGGAPGKGAETARGGGAAAPPRGRAGAGLPGAPAAGQGREREGRGGRGRGGDGTGQGGASRTVPPAKAAAAIAAAAAAAAPAIAAAAAAAALASSSSSSSSFPLPRSQSSASAFHVWRSLPPRAPLLSSPVFFALPFVSLQPSFHAPFPGPSLKAAPRLPSRPSRSPSPPVRPPECPARGGERGRGSPRWSPPRTAAPAGPHRCTPFSGVTGVSVVWDWLPPTGRVRCLPSASRISRSTSTWSSSAPASSSSCSASSSVATSSANFATRPRASGTVTERSCSKEMPGSSIYTGRPAPSAWKTSREKTSWACCLANTPSIGSVW